MRLTLETLGKIPHCPIIWMIDRSLRHSAGFFWVKAFSVLTSTYYLCKLKTSDNKSITTNLLWLLGRGQLSYMLYLLIELSGWAAKPHPKCINSIRPKRVIGNQSKILLILCRNKEVNCSCVSSFTLLWSNTVLAGRIEMLGAMCHYSMLA